MATYKLDVKKRYGKFFYNLRQATEQGKESDPLDTLDAVLASVEKDFTDRDIGPDDSVIFRGIAYSSYTQLKEVVRTSPF
jgi:hypothetical protein